MSDLLTPPRPTVPLDGGVPLVAASTSRRQWPLVLAYGAFPVLWVLGAGVLSFLLGGALAWWMVLRRRGAWEPAPPAVWVWVGLLAWTATGVLVLGPLDRVVAYGYRLSFLLAATGLLLVVVGTRRAALSDRTVLRTVSVLWFLTVAGGMVALVAPGLEFTTIVERLLPGRLLEIGLVRNIVHLQIAAESRFLGVPVGRPEAPFPFTNAWGSNLTLLTPLVLATWSLQPTRRWRLVTGVLLAASAVPLALSLNRGAWLSLGIGLLYVLVRLAVQGDPRRVLAMGVAGVVVLGAVLVSPVGDLVVDRLTGPGHSDQGRTSLYEQALDLAAASPLVGHGAPQPNELDPEGPSIGTHGQLWLLLVAHGVPAVLLYVAFFAVAWVAALRWRAPHAVWLEACLVIAAVQFPIYELMPVQTITLAVVAGLALRGRRTERQRLEAWA